MKSADNILFLIFLEDDVKNIYKYNFDHHPSLFETSASAVPDYGVTKMARQADRTLHYLQTNIDWR